MLPSLIRYQVGSVGCLLLSIDRNSHTSADRINHFVFTAGICTDIQPVGIHHRRQAVRPLLIECQLINRNLLRNNLRQKFLIIRNGKSFPGSVRIRSRFRSDCFACAGFCFF